MRFCGKCGAQISEKAIYCEMCGVKLFEYSQQYNKKIDDKVAGKQETPEQEIEELDLTNLNKDMNITTPTPDTVNIDLDTTSNIENKIKNQSKKTKMNNEKVDNPEKKMIDLKEVLEAEEKTEMDDSIKREVLTDEEELTKVCPMCGEEMTINKKLLENTPVLVKCLKCGQETKIW